MRRAKISCLYVAGAVLGFGLSIACYGIFRSNIFRSASRRTPQIIEGQTHTFDYNGYVIQPEEVDEDVKVDDLNLPEPYSPSMRKIWMR